MAGCLSDALVARWEMLGWVRPALSEESSLAIREGVCLVWGTGIPFGHPCLACVVAADPHRYVGACR